MMTTEQQVPVSIALIVGSTREERRGEAVARWVLDQLAGDSDVEIDLVDLAEFVWPERFTFSDRPDLDRLRRTLDKADAYVVVTPEYNHSYPASLKQAIDYAKDEWARKPVGFVSYGGVSGGLRAVEHLRQVFNELQAHGIRNTVSFHGPWNGFRDDDRPTDPVAAAQALSLLVDELQWWSRALLAARRTRLETV